MKTLGVILCLSLIQLSIGDQHKHAHGPLGTFHENIEAPSPVGCNRRKGISIAPANVITLNVSAAVYNSSQMLHVTWIPQPNACNDDFIGAYFTEIPRFRHCRYLDFQFISGKAQGLATWRMLNLRRTLNFRYYSRQGGCNQSYSLVGESVVVQPMNPNEPTHIHLAYADRLDQMYVSFTTNSSQVTPVCQYGLTPTALTFQQNGTSLTYKAADMCELKAIVVGPQNFIDPGFIHTVVLQNLLPSTKYYYRVGNNLHGWSPVYSFTNRPADENAEVHIIAYGDMGVAPIGRGAQSTVDRVTAQINSLNVTSLMHIGDISYARGIGALWEAYMTLIQPVASRIPYMVGIGNHEYDHLTGGEHDPSGAPLPGGFHPSWGDYGADSGGECAVPVVRRFRTPLNGLGVFWYSYDVGPVHILMFSTEHHFEEGSRQYLWIQNDLKSVNRTRTPWIVVGSHRPMFASDFGDNADQLTSIATQLQLHLEPMFYRHKVDVNLFAHLHSYERSCAMYQEKCVNDGITHVLIGMSGIGLNAQTRAAAHWSRYRDAKFGYTTIIANKTVLHFRYHHNANDNVADQFVLTK